MDTTATLDAPCRTEDLLVWVRDLDRYPHWLSIVRSAEPAPAISDDPGPAWSVELRGAIGPLARSKRLRMVRVEATDAHIRFERREADGRAHSPWVLEADVRESGDGSQLVMHLHYGGALWGPLLERLLGDEIEASRPRLLACLPGGAQNA